MKITKEEISEILEIVSHAEDFRPLVKQIIEILKSYSDELREIPEAIGKWIVERRITSIKQYEGAGFDRDDALLMTLDDIYAVRKLANRQNDARIRHNQ